MAVRGSLLAAAALLSVQLAARAQAAEPAPAPPPHRRLADRLTPCHVAGLEEEVLCGRHEVFENRAAQRGRKIGLHLVVLPAKSPVVADDPLVFLAGGGVVPASRYAGFFAKGFAALREHRDIVLLDQRGSGGSNELDCPLSTDPANAEYRDADRFVAAVRRCRAALEQKADLRLYSTPIAMDDLDEVRAWLGYRRLNLYGASYGTQAAMVYLRRHPGSVRSIALQGVVPLDLPMWLEAPRTVQQALEAVFSACAGQSACQAAFPHLAEEFSDLLERLAAKPLKVEVSKPQTGKRVEVPIDDQVLRAFVLSCLYGADRIHDLPLLIHLAEAGDLQPIALKLAEREGSEIPKGVYFSIICNEELHFTAAALNQASVGTFMGPLRLSREALACREWPRSAPPDGYWTPVSSPVPALVMTGALDAITPPRYGAHVATTLANARVLVLPGRSHNDADDCVTGIVSAFVEAGGAQGLDTSCLDKTPPQSFALAKDQLSH